MNASNPEDAVEVEVNCPDLACARQIAEAAVTARLAACANLIGGVESVYRWQGTVETAQEVALRLKTRRDRLDALFDLIAGLHPYDLPAITALPVVAANPGYGAWLAAETG